MSRKTVALVACAAAKLPFATAARDLYVSSLFRKAREYAEQNGDSWYILSAKHGLVRPDRVIEPYDVTLNATPIAERRRWSARVNQQLENVVSPGDRLIMLAGARYREGVESVQRSRDVAVEVPMQGMRIGEQLQWLSK